jgi:hypothetical protein
LEAEERNFLIAPTMFMKTKVKLKPKSIAPTMSMKINKLFDFLGEGHDVVVKTGVYRRLGEGAMHENDKIPIEMAHFRWAARHFVSDPKADCLCSSIPWWLKGP